MNISEIVLNFKEIERGVQRDVNKLGCAIVKETLEGFDVALMEARDKSIYRYHSKKPTVLKTVMGEVEYSRILYETQDADGKTIYVYLLDEALGNLGSGHFSELLSDYIVEACCEGSYRHAARTVSELTGQTISHTAAWNVVQEIGERVGKHEAKAAQLASKNSGVDTTEAKVLFEEQDGIMLSLQGQSRKDHGPKKEMKVAIAYDGAEKTGKNRYTLTNKVACANFEPGEQFAKRKEGVIAGIYNVDEIIIRLLGGDGAKWIRRSQTDESVHFQLDPYHRNEAILRYVSDQNFRKMITDLLYSKDIDLLLHVIEVELLSADDEKGRENYEKLLSYFSSNKDGLIPFHRRGLDLPPPPEGKEYRRLGAMESNIFTIIGNRMKGGRANWSIAGGNNLARLLSLKHTGRLTNILNSLSSWVLPERYAEEIVVEFSAAKIPLREGKGYNGFHQTLIPSSMKWLKDLVAIRPFEEVSF
jgi:hypothetical protein